MAKRIGIIGSGITALGNAWALTQQGHDCLVLERSDQIGGAIQSVRDGAHLAEEGPNSIQVNTPEMLSFLTSVPGLESRMIEAKPAAKKRFIVRRGKLHAVPANPIRAITTKLWSIRGRMRVLREPFIQSIDPETEESAADFVRRRLGDELYRYAINPLIGGIYAGNPEQLSLRYAFPKLYALEQEHGGLIRGGLAKMREAKKRPGGPFRKRIVSFKDGLAELPKHIALALGDRVQTNICIESIRFRESQWHVAIDGGIESFDELIITIPAHAIKTLPFTEEVVDQLAALDKIHYPPVSVVSMAYKRDAITHPLDGFGALVPECESRKILGVLFPSSVFQDRSPKGEVMLTTFVGGDRQPELANLEEKELTKLVETELADLLGASGTPTFVHIRKWPKAIPQYQLGYGELLKEMDRIEENLPGLKLAGNYRTGISLSYCIEESAIRRS